MVLSFSDAWKKDTLACAGTRERITRDSLNIIEKCEGISERDFISLFGQPNAIKYYRSHKNYYYWASCIIMPESKGFPEEINENARQLIVRIDSLSMIEQIILAVP